MRPASGAARAARIASVTGRPLLVARADADELMLAVLLVGTAQGEPSGPGRREGERVTRAGDPLRSQRVAAEIVDERRVGRRHLVVPLVEDRPVVLPADGGEERLASVDVKLRGEPTRPHAEIDRRPLPRRQHDQVRVAGVLDRVGGAAVGENRVRRIALERPGDGT
jgi:hypothetical protein